MRLAAQDVRIGGGIMLAAGAVWPLLGAGLPSLACPLLSTTGIPCPLCGMTTSVVAAIHGDLAGAVSANPFGLVAIGAAVWLLADRSREWLRAPWWVWGGAVAASWVFQVARLT